MSGFLEFLGILFVCILIGLVISWMLYITYSVDKLQDQVNSNAKISNNNYDDIDNRLDKLEKISQKDKEG